MHDGGRMFFGPSGTHEHTYSENGLSIANITGMLLLANTQVKFRPKISTRTAVTVSAVFAIIKILTS